MDNCLPTLKFPSCHNEPIITLEIRDKEEQPRMTKKEKKDYDQTKI